MTRPLSVALVLTTVALSFAAAQAQDFTAAQRAACKADYETYCKGTMPGGGRIIKCLASHYENLGGACKKVVDANKK
jgi:hypothetical protein